MGFWRCLPSHSVVVLAFAASGCAYSYVDSNHTRHVIGIVDIATLQTSEQNATSVTMTTVGLSVYRQSGSDSAITLGYNQRTLVSLPNNACLNLSGGKPCEAASPQSDTKGGP